MYMISILVLIGIAYAALGYDYINDELYALNHFRHFLTSGVYGLVFYLVIDNNLNHSYRKTSIYKYLLQT